MTPCSHDPDRWAGATQDDPEARAICLACPVRRECAKRAVEMVNNYQHPSGIWAGVYLPFAPNRHQYPRSRGYAVKRLRLMVETKPVGANP